MCVTELKTVSTGAKYSSSDSSNDSSSDDSSHYSSSDYDCKRLRRKKRARRPEPDDKEFVKRCLRAPRENRSTDNRDASAIHTS
jgi:hypothetical protein